MQQGKTNKNSVDSIYLIFIPVYISNATHLRPPTYSAYVAQKMQTYSRDYFEYVNVQLASADLVRQTKLPALSSSKYIFLSVCARCLQKIKANGEFSIKIELCFCVSVFANLSLHVSSNNEHYICQTLVT